MAEFEYQAETDAGELVRGFVNAGDESAARRDVESRGLTVIDLVWCPQVDEAGTLHDEQVITLTSVLGSAAENKLPLELTLAVLAEERGDPRLASVAAKLARQLEQGQPLDRAVESLQEELPADVRGLMRVGVEANDLAGTIDRYTHQRVATQRVNRQIRAAIAYPLLVLAILVPLLLLLSVYVIPMFAELYRDFEMELPILTELILQTSSQVPGLVAGLLALVVVVPLALRLLGGRWLFHRFRMATPMIGQLWIWAGQREFASLLASFLDARIPLVNAVAFTGELMSDRNIAHSCRRLNQRLESGESLSASMQHSINFDRGLVAMAAWGENHGALPDALRIASEVFDDRIEQHVSLVRRLLPPIALVVVGSLLLFVMVGLFVPLVQLIQGLSM